MAKKMKPGQKRCPTCGAGVSGTRTKICPMCGHGFNGKPQESPAHEAAPATVASAKPTTNGGGTITLDQVKKVAHTIKSLGGFQHVTEVLEVIKEMGGVKKFKDLAEAMSVTETNDIPF
jgi:uncharacterized Zn finger protein (UPF0148 family)